MSALPTRNGTIVPKDRRAEEARVRAGGGSIVPDPRDPRAEAAIARWGELKRTRAHHEADWEDIARLIRPQRSNFTTAGHVEMQTTEKALSSAPIVAQSNFSSGLYGTMTNPSNKWMGFRLTDPDLGKHHSIKLWLDQVSHIVLASFLPSTSPFYSAAIQLFADVSSFGNAAQYDEVVRSERKILDITLSLAQVVVAVDGFGRVDEVVRRFPLTARQAVKMFAAERLPPKLLELAEKGSADKIEFYHHVGQNVDWRRGKLGPAGKRWFSIYACDIGPALVRESGYAEMPFFLPRWEVDTGQTYGRGPGMLALPDARVLQQMDAATLRAAQKAADPTLLAPHRDAWQLSGVVRPGQVVYGGLNFQGQQLVRVLDNFSSTGLTQQEKQARIENIRDAFHWSLMNLAGRTGMTATEVIERQEEKLRLMAPHMGRIQEEYLAPKIGRRFFLLWRAGQIPPPPPELGVAGEVGLEVEYLSAAAMAQKSGEGAAVVRVLQDVTPLAQIKPRLIDRLSEDDLLEVLVDARGAPARIMRSREEADAIAQQRDQVANAQAAMQAAPAASGVLRDLAAMQPEAAA